MFITWGTYHFAKKNLLSEVARCSSCGFTSALSSYDAFKCGHLYFVPLLPMGFVRVLQKCRCGAHFERGLKQFEAERRSAQAALASGWEQDRSDLQAAVEALQLYSIFGPQERAAEVAAHLKNYVARDPEIRQVLISWYASRGQLEEATELRDEAEASGGLSDDGLRELALTALATGDVASARDNLLKIVEPAQGDFFPLLRVAASLEQQARGKEAYEVYQFVCTNFPEHMARHSVARAAVRRLEKQQRVRPSILPAGAGQHRDKLLGLAVALVLVIGLAVTNEVLKRSQSLYVLNATGSEATVQVGADTHVLSAGTSVRLDIEEGRHPVSVSLSNGHRYDLTVDVRNSLWQRAHLKNVFVLDVLGASALSREEIIYGGSGNEEPRGDLMAGHLSYTFHDVDYAFRNPPRSITTKSYKETHILLGSITADPVELGEALAVDSNAYPHVNVRGYLEGHLLSGEDDPRLVSAYQSHCEATCAEEARTLLAKLGIASAPVVQESP